MKAMNYLATLVFVILLSACTNEEQPLKEELRVIELNGEEIDNQEIFEVDLRQYFVLNNIEDLENQKSELIEQIEFGNEELLPELEVVLNDLQTNYSILETILQNTCILLELRFEILTSQVEDGNLDALDELAKIEEKLEDCGVEVESYLSQLFEGHPVMFAATIGSRCSPGREWKCKNIMNEGRVLINVEEEIAERTEARFKTSVGEVISTGAILGAHQSLEGMLQIELQLEQIEDGVLEISTGGDIMEIPIEVR